MKYGKKVGVDVLWRKDKPNGQLRVQRATYIKNGIHEYLYQVCIFKKNKRSKMLWSSSWVPEKELLHNLQLAIHKANGHDH